MSGTQLSILLIATLAMLLCSYIFTKILAELLLVNSNHGKQVSSARNSVIIAGSFLTMGVVTVLGWKIYTLVLILGIILGVGLSAIPSLQKFFLYFISVLIGVSGSLIYAVAKYLIGF